jgi:hypothetical protein
MPQPWLLLLRDKFDDKAANFLAAFPSYYGFGGGIALPSLRIDRDVREIFPLTN